VTNPTNGYGDLGTLETRSPANADPVAAGTKYAFGCGNCHPTDGSKHMNGTVDAALARPASATGSLKDLNASTASYNADPSSPRTCSGVYCHSTGQATPEFAVTPAWDSGTKLGCAGCHENPPKYASGGAGTATANTHVVAGDDGYAVGHFGGFHGPWGNSYHGYTMGAGGYDSAPITCQTCHFDTTDPTNTGPSGFYYLDTSGNYSDIDPSNGLPSIIYDPITDTGALNNDACKNCHTAGSGVAPQGNGRVLPLRHVNGQRDVVFDARSSAGSLVGYPGAPSEPNLKPYWWSNIGAPGRLPLGAVWENGTWSSDLRSAGYNPSTKTCSNVACHIDQGTPTGPPLVWGTLPVGWASCDACHGYARP
jgi:predicted CxxxxCH...CXXCH cytochrome family protein